MALSHPTHGTAILGGGIGTAGSNIIMQLDSSTWDNFTIMEEISGDGDDGARHDTNDFLYCSFILRGWMVAGATVGIQILRSQSVASPVLLSVKFSSGERFPITGTVSTLIKNIIVNHRARAVNIGVVVVGKVISTITSDIGA